MLSVRLSSFSPSWEKVARRNAPRRMRARSAIGSRESAFRRQRTLSAQTTFGPRNRIGVHIWPSAALSAAPALEITSNVSSIAAVSFWPVSPPAARPSVVHSNAQPLLPPARASIHVHLSSQIFARRTKLWDERDCLSVRSSRSVRFPSASSNTLSHSTECVLCFNARDRRRKPSSTSAIHS